MKSLVDFNDGFTSTAENDAADAEDDAGEHVQDQAAQQHERFCAA